MYISEVGMLRFSKILGKTGVSNTSNLSTVVNLFQCHRTCTFSIPNLDPEEMNFSF